MTKIRDAQVLVGTLEQGDLNVALSSEIAKTLEELHDQSRENPKGSIKGSVTLKIEFTVENETATVRPEITAKVPSRPRRATVFFLLEDGTLSTEHPRQHDMFGGPREIPARR